MTDNRPAFEIAAAELSAPALALYRRLEALNRINARAERRIGLGTQLFTAAETLATRCYHMIQQLKSEQDSLATQVHDGHAPFADAAGGAGPLGDDGVTLAIRSIEAKMARLQSDWTRTQARIAEMMQRSETLLQ